MTTTAELPEDLRNLAVTMFRGTENAVGAHSQLRLEIATFLIRRMMPTATGIGVDVEGWYDRDGGVDLSEVRDYAGRLLWRSGDSAPGELPGVDQADYRLRWHRLLAEIEGELSAALTFSTPSSCGWEAVEESEFAEMPYWIELPGSPAQSHMKSLLNVPPPA